MLARGTTATYLYMATGHVCVTIGINYIFFSHYLCALNSLASTLSILGREEGKEEEREERETEQAHEWMLMDEY